MLDNIKKIILLENLFYNREVITREQAYKICGIERRSFFRYLNLLSEINIPIYYDKHVKGYRLSNKHLNKNINFTINETLLMVLGLRNLLKIDSDHFQNEINTLLKKIISSSHFNIEETLEPFDEQINTVKQSKNILDLIISLLIDLAIKNKYSMKVHYCNGKGNQEITIENPGLEFKNNWLLKDLAQPLHIPIDQIDYIKIL